LVAGSEAISVEPGTTSPHRLNASCILENNTIAARHAVFHLGDALGLASDLEPLILQARANVFLDPFRGTDHRAGVLLCDGQALPHGLLIWQGEANLYDQQFHFYGASDQVAESKQSFSAWERLWGSVADRPPEREISLLRPEARTFELDHPQLDLLAVSAVLPKVAGIAPGANLEQLGIVTKAKGKSKK
jgi:hypothetical protein